MSDPARERELFERALAQPTAERRAFLDRTCGRDPELRRRLERLLQAHGEAEAAPTGPLVEMSGLLDDPTAIGPYRVLGRLAEGGMGVVLDAEQVEPIRRRVAIKIIKPGMDSRQVLRRFEAERQTLALLDHPNVARVIDAGATDAGRPYFVMEHVSGRHVTTYCDLEELGIEPRLGLFLQICDAVQHAHMKGVIHRDLKPSNVLVAERDGQPVAKVIDFGIAKALSPETGTVHTEQGQVIGTPQYMSPEQATGNDVDTRTDVYSLGAMLYELLTGSTPIDPASLGGSGLAALQRAICDTEPPRPSTRISGVDGGEGDARARLRRHDAPSLARRLSGDLDWITMKTLEKDRERRYSTAAELAADVERHLRNEPVLAGPPSAAYRARKFVRRHRLGVGLAAAAVVMLAGFAVTMAAQARRIAAERDRATEALSYLKQVFKVSDPSVARGGEITARELLDKSAAQIDEQLAERPELHAEMAATIGQVYSNLGLYDRAEPLLSKALETRRRVLGDRHPDTLSSINNMGVLLQNLGKLAEAEDYYREALEGNRRVRGADDPITLTSIHNMGDVLKDQGKLAEAEGYYREALEGSRRVLGPDHPDTLISMNNMGLLLHDQGKLAEAEGYYRETLERKRRVLGPDHPSTLTSLNGMGALLQRQGKLAEAEGYYREALESRRHVLGPDHPDTLRSISNMGVLLQDLGKLAEAEDQFREALEGRRRVLGADHPQTALSLRNLAAHLNKQRRFAEAEPLLREALEIYPKQLDAGHWWIAMTRSNLGESLAGLGRHAEAEPLLLESQRAIEASTEASAKQKRDAVERLVVLYAALGRRDDEARWRAKLAELP